MRISEPPPGTGTIETGCILTLQRQSGNSVESVASTRSNFDTRVIRRGRCTIRERDPMSSITSDASSRIVNSFGLTILIGPVTSSWLRGAHIGAQQATAGRTDKVIE
jgi:hypothetical protein